MAESSTGVGRHYLRFVYFPLFMLLMITWANEAPAIPAFARKYQTSCMTCHVAFPALTPFGEAFRLNGYRFPSGTDVNVSKDEPVQLGAEGYKRMWPKAVWPGEIPGLPPLSMVVENEIAYDRIERTTSLDGLGGELAILAGGTLGERMSFYGELEFARADEGVETELERLSIFFRPFDTTAFQFKVGAFEPGLLLVSNHRRLTDHRYFILGLPATEKALGFPATDNEWTAEPLQQGLEVFGVAAHRVLYNVGLVEGSGNAHNNNKDYYVRLAYKIGGLCWDGTVEGDSGAEFSSNPKPWSEKSLSLSAFTYQGIAELSSMEEALAVTSGGVLFSSGRRDIIAQGAPLQENRFHIYGGDAAVNFLDLLAHGGVSIRTDDRPVLENPNSTDVKINNFFGELAWVAYPWLIPTARWEAIDVADVRLQRISITANALVRANVKSFVAADWLREPGDDFRTEEVVGGIIFGF